MMRRRRGLLVAAVRRTALAAAAVSLASGCAYFGPQMPVDTLRATPQPGGALLDTGAYPTTASSPPGTAGPGWLGRVLEGHRMANYVVVPSQVDPRLTRAIPQNTNTLQTADDLPAPLDEDDRKAFIVGFSTARSSAARQVLINIVLRFTTAAAAADVAGDTAALYARTTGTPHGGTVSIPGGRLTLAFASETAEGAELHSVTPHGPYVLFQYARSKQGVNDAITLVSKTLDMQEPLIDQFVPDDPSRFADLPTDETGLLSRTLPDPDVPAGGFVYQPRAALHFQDDSAKAATMFAASGVLAVSAGKSTVYEAADPSTAQGLADSFAADRHNDGYRPAAPVNGLPVRCFDGGRDNGASPRNFYCIGSARRYVYEIFSTDQVDAHRQVAAQYRLLMQTDQRW